jgi:CRISPR-associated protein Cmr5
MEPLAGQNKEYCEKYKSMAEKLPALIRTAGLAQALAVVEAKALKEPAWGDLLDHLATTVGYADKKALSAASRSPQSTLGAYARLTTRVLEALLWYKRFAQSLLSVQPASAAQSELPNAGGPEQ